MLFAAAAPSSAASASPSIPTSSLRGFRRRTPCTGDSTRPQESTSAIDWGASLGSDTSCCKWGTAWSVRRVLPLRELNQHATEEEDEEEEEEEEEDEEEDEEEEEEGQGGDEDEDELRSFHTIESSLWMDDWMAGDREVLGASPVVLSDAVVTCCACNESFFLLFPESIVQFLFLPLG